MPAGFVALPSFNREEFTARAGPLFLKDEAGLLVAGFRVMEHHLNPNRVCHGGMLATFCDVYMAMAAIYASEVGHRLLPTVNLSMDFLEPAPAGAWVEGRAELLREGRRIVVVQGLLRADGRLVARANGTFAVPPGDAGSERPQRDALRRLLRVGLKA